MRCFHAWLVIIHVHDHVTVAVKYYFKILITINTKRVADPRLSEYIYNTISATASGQPVHADFTCDVMSCGISLAQNKFAFVYSFLFHIITDNKCTKFVVQLMV